MSGVSEGGYYSDLGVSPSATTDEIKAIYRALAKIYHPDVNHEQAAATTFRRITTAYEVLSDPERRREYDAELAEEHTPPEPNEGKRAISWPTVTRNCRIFAEIVLVAAIGAYFLYERAGGILDEYWQQSTVALEDAQHVVVNNSRGDRLLQPPPLVAVTKISPNSPATPESIDKERARGLDALGVRPLDGAGAKGDIGETLIKRPPPTRAAQNNMAALHAGETLIKRPPPTRAVQNNMAALHAGETLT